MPLLLAILLTIPGTSFTGVQPMLKPPAGFVGFMSEPDGRICWATIGGTWGGLDICLARGGPGVLTAYTGPLGANVAEFRAAHWRVINTAPLAPAACNAGSAGVVIYVDDTNDGKPAKACMCMTGAVDGVYAWTNMVNFTTPCF